MSSWYARPAAQQRGRRSAPHPRAGAAARTCSPSWLAVAACRRSNDERLSTLPRDLPARAPVGEYGEGILGGDRPPRGLKRRPAGSRI
jgi:hypothetical protein